MENLLTLVIFIVFVVVTIVKKMGGQSETPGPAPEPKNVPDFKDIRDIFTQFFGSDSKELPAPNEKEQKPIPQSIQTLLDAKIQEERASKERPEDVIQSAEEYILRTRENAFKTKVSSYKPPLPAFQSRKQSPSKIMRETLDKRPRDKARLIPQTLQDAQQGIVFAEIFGPPLSLR